MSYPFGSGMPQPNSTYPYPNQNQGGGYPNQGGYPSQNQFPYSSLSAQPSSTYPQQSPYSNMPFHQPPMMPFGSGFLPPATHPPPLPSQSAYSLSQAAFQASQLGFSSSQPRFQAPQLGYSSSQPGYPSSQPRFQAPQPGFQASQPGFQASQPGFQASQPGFQASQIGYSSSQPVYPSSQPGYPSSKPEHHMPYSSLPQSSHPSATSGSVYPSLSSAPPKTQPSHPLPSSTNSTPLMSNQSSFTQQMYPTQQNKGQPQLEQNATTQTGYSNTQNVVGKLKGNPTVVPASNFDPVNDAKALRKAMKGFGTDENALIDVICRRSNEQRMMILRSYKTNFGKDLIEDIKSETSGNFENLLVALLTPIIDFYVKELHDAMAGIGTNEDVLIEILCSMTNIEIHTIKNAYERLYGKNLESELISETSGHFKRLLVSLCNANRDESGVTDLDSARRDATELLRAGELRVGTDESTFNMILCQRNFQQIRLICNEYEKISGHSLERAIRNEFSGDIMEGLVAILQCTSNKCEFFASRLHKSMAGLGTNDTQLIRIIVTRCEIDLNDIKVAYEQKYGKSLRSWIKGDTSGHYKHALYALIGEQRSS